MNKILIASLASLAATGTALGVVAARQVPTVRANTFVGPVAVGGLEPMEAGKKIRAWWEGERKDKLNGANLMPLAAMLKAKIGKPKPASVRWVGGMVQTTPETTVMRLDAKA